MCGICGLVDFNGHLKTGETERAILQMQDLLAHRGPDDDGYFHKPPVALGHRRLAIIDLEGNRQPLSDESGRYTLVFNGEIYNYIELRKELETLGLSFRTTGDTEVLLNALIAWKENSLERLVGMFAFAFWDSTEKALFLARDRIGKKPLYYLHQKDVFVFASELRAFRGILPFFNLSLCEEALYQYFHLAYIPAPLSIFKEVKKLPPGCYLTVFPEQASLTSYWQMPLSIQRDLSNAVEELEALLEEATRLRLRSDVPLGGFLSGGIDSSLICALMKKNAGADVLTFSVGFREETFDESPYAASVAAFLKTRHQVGNLTLAPEELLLELVSHYGEPFGDSSALPTWLLCQETRKHVKVAISGDGGDELFVGYRRYQARALVSWYQRLLPEPVRKIIRILALHLPEDARYYDKSIAKKIRLAAGLEARTDTEEDLFPPAFTKKELESLLPSIPPVPPPTLPQEASGLSAIEQMVLFDLLYYLPDDILVKVDRASMAHSLEVRCPILDHRVIEFAVSLPIYKKFRLPNHTKILLKELSANYLPEDIIRRPKHGFSIPLGSWFKRELRSVFEEKVLYMPLPEIISPKMERRLFEEHLLGKRDHGHRLWLILFFHLWWTLWF